VAGIRRVRRTGFWKEPGACIEPGADGVSRATRSILGGKGIPGLPRSLKATSWSYGNATAGGRVVPEKEKAGLI